MPAQKDKNCGCPHQRGSLKWKIIAIVLCAIISGVVFGATGAVLLGTAGKWLGAVLGVVLGAYVGRSWKVTRFTDLFLLPPKDRQ